MDNLSILKNTLRVFGVAFVLIMPMMKLDPLGGWAWSPGQWEYEMMNKEDWIQVCKQKFFNKFFPNLLR